MSDYLTQLLHSNLLPPLVRLEIEQTLGQFSLDYETALQVLCKHLLETLES